MNNQLHVRPTFFSSGTFLSEFVTETKIEKTLGVTIEIIGASKQE